MPVGDAESDSNCSEEGAILENTGASYSSQIEGENRWKVMCD